MSFIQLYVSCFDNWSAMKTGQQSGSPEAAKLTLA